MILRCPFFINKDEKMFVFTAIILVILIHSEHNAMSHGINIDLGCNKDYQKYLQIITDIFNSELLRSIINSSAELMRALIELMCGSMIQLIRALIVDISNVYINLALH
jgi:hypothetical protein